MGKNNKNRIILTTILIGIVLGSINDGGFKTNPEPESSSIETPPIVTGLRGGTMDMGVYTEYTENFPWAHYKNEYDMYEPLYWEVDFTNDTEITDYLFNATYGSLDGLNGSTFTQLSEVFLNYSPGGPILEIWEGTNAYLLEDFGYLITVWIVDDDDVTSEVYQKLFKYHNGTVEIPPDPLLFSVTTPDVIINPTDDLPISYVIDDPEGEGNYSVDMTCDQDISLVNQTVTNISAIFNEFHEDAWTLGLTYNFTFTLNVWEEASIVSSEEASISVYINKPPENGTCVITPTEGISGVTTFVITCMDWADDRDSSDLLQYGAYILIAGGAENMVVPYQTPHLLSLTLSPAGNYIIYVRIFDQDGGFSDFALPIVSVNSNPSGPPRGVPGGTLGLVWGSLGMISVILYKTMRKAKR